MKHVLFVSNMAGPGWGGSEELWAQTALRLRSKGFRVSANVLSSPQTKRLVELANAGCRVERRSQISARVKQIIEIVYRDKGDEPLPLLKARALSAALNSIWYRRLDRLRPDFVVISQADNYSGWDWMRACAARRIPFVTIAQAASESVWPTLSLAEAVADPYRAALRQYFVSERNLQLTRMQILDPLINAEIVRNPFNVSYEKSSVTLMPDMSVIKLACVGRLHPPSKGQDLILELMALPKWRARPIEVTLYGSGAHQSSLQKMICTLDLRNVKIAGFQSDVQAIWNQSHGLLLPSRSEGLPLAVVEAMLCGRVPIVTDVGGNVEVVDDRRTGFIAGGATVAALDKTLEVAWMRRSEWPQIGADAAESIRMLVPADPAANLASNIVKLMDDLA